MAGAVRRAQRVRAQRGNAHPQLKRRISSFYDQSSSLWERVWGSEHMHHALYPGGVTRPSRHHQGQVDMMDAALDFTGCDTARLTSLLDAGCGVGGASFHLLRKAARDDTFACGITLSETQARRANELAERDGFAERSDFFVADVVDMPFEDESFDLSWSLEVGEHVPDRDGFVDEISRVTAPGGHVLVVAWTCRELRPGESSLPPAERELLNTISRAYHLPEWSPASTYIHAMNRNGLCNIRSADWSLEVSPFWGAVLQKAATPEGLSGLLNAGVDTITGAAAMPLMQIGFNAGTVRFSVLAAEKAETGNNGRPAALC